MLRREARDDAAFAAWVEAHGAGLLRVAYLLTGDGHQAEELVQSVLARALPVWATVAARGEPLSYVRRALVNERTDVWRARGRREALAADVPERSHPDHAPALDLRRDLLVALQRLPRRQRAVVVLRYLEDLPDDAIAGLLRCSEGTVRSQASRALVKLRPLLAGDVPEGCVS
ncbi:MAG TPA: SigE family RNA polymerase sigma factor [Frankiaceae bacterium]|jgi:RNA polymerase sigma-70 factor (sigma-E family)|nr:SigE family RNA polymerase sigma factor [Frankiaceae bacterium]